MSDKTVQLNGYVKDISEKAVLLTVDGITGWVPDSQADYIDEPEVGTEIDFIIPEWLADSKRFLD